MENTADHGSRRTGNGRRNRTSKKSRSNSGLLKVVYISTPMKVKTSASMFRSIVQELTGKYSDVARYMEKNVGFNEFNDEDDDVKNSWMVMMSADADNNSTEGKTDEAINVDDDGRLLANQFIIDQNVFHESPTGSDSLYNNEHQFEFDDGSLDVLTVDHLEGMFGSNYLMESTLDDITFEDFCLAA